MGWDALLSRQLVTEVLDFLVEDIALSVPGITRYCGKSGVTLGVIVDPDDQLMEPDEGNNIAMTTVQVTGCRGKMSVSKTIYIVWRIASALKTIYIA